MLSEISYSERQISYDLIRVIKKENQAQRTDWQLPEAGVGGIAHVGKMSEGVCQKVQNSSYKISKSWGCNVQHSDYS